MSAHYLTNGHAPSLTKSEAESLVKRIQAHITDARALVLELYTREGWKALGYDSWRACVVAEFEQSQSYLYRLLNAAQVEQNISPMGENGPIAERALRPLTKLEPEQQRDVWQRATRLSPKPTVELVTRITPQLGIGRFLDPAVQELGIKEFALKLGYSPLEPGNFSLGFYDRFF